MVQCEIRIKGRVHGVGFRYYAWKKAIEHNISGWVKNTPQGDVLIAARGSETDIQTFIDYLQIGPPAARVKNVYKSPMEIKEEFSTFTIRY